MNLSDALGGWPAADNNQSGANSGPWPGQPANPTWPAAGGGGAGGGGGIWPGQNPQPNAPGVWPSPAPASGPVWPGPAPAPAPGPGVWPGPAPAPAPGPGVWPGPAPGPGPGPGPAPQPHVPSAPQYNLAIPFNQPLPNGVHDKMLITIAGTVKPNANKITVDFSTTQDLAFHFNPRFNEGGHKVIVRNSCIGKKWGKEERDLRHFPFVAGQPFEMKIMCTSREFKVAVNNSHLLEFKHRLTNLRAITRLSVHNDLSLSRFNVETLP